MTAVISEGVTRSATGGYFVGNSRVSLESVLLEHQRGQSAEAIVRNFPSLSVDEVNAAIYYYSRHRVELDGYLAAQAECWKELKAESEARNSELLEKVRNRILPI